MQKVWIVVASAVRARLFEVHALTNDWSLVESLDHPRGYERTGELVTDHEGSSSPQGGSVHHDARAPKTDPREVETEIFVRAVVGVLDRGVRARSFSHLVLVAPPHLLGMLKKALTPQLRKRVLATVDKDHERLDTRALATELESEVRIPLDEVEVMRGPESHPH